MMNLVFDLGNVLLTYEHLNYVKQFVSDPVRAEAVDRAIFSHPKRPELDRGTMTDADLIPVMIADAPAFEDDIRRIMANWLEMIGPKPDGQQLLRDAVAQGIPCYYLSNYPEEGFRVTAARMGFLELFTDGIISAPYRVVKPEPAIYRLFLERCGLKAEECIFMDDMPENVAAAQAEGFNSFVFTTGEAARRILREEYGLPL